MEEVFERPLQKDKSVMFWIGFGDIFKEVFERPLQKDNSERFQRSFGEV